MTVLLPALVLTGEAVAFVVFAAKYPVVLFNLLSFSLCSAVGQVSAYFVNHLT